MPNPTNFDRAVHWVQIDPGQANVATGALTPKTGMTWAANVRIGNDPRNLVAGTPWNFTFLKYSAGDVTTCALNGNAMTGPFTGCYAFTYNSNVQPTLAHVGAAHHSGEYRFDLRQTGLAKYRSRRSHEHQRRVTCKAVLVGEQKKVSMDNQLQLPIVCSYYEAGKAWAILFVPAVAGVTVVPGVLRIEMARAPCLNWTGIW